MIIHFISHLHYESSVHEPGPLEKAEVRTAELNQTVVVENLRNQERERGRRIIFGNFSLPETRL